MKKLVPVIFLGLVFGYFYFRQDEKVDFLSYKNRKPANVVKENKVVEEKKPEKKIKTVVKKAELKPLSSREIAAQGIESPKIQPKIAVTEIAVGNSRYGVVSHVYAVKKRDWDAKDPNIIGEHLGHFLIESPTEIAGSSPVVLNKKNQNFAIVTKVLKVKLSDLSYEAEIFGMPYEIKERYDHIQVVLYYFNSLEELLEAQSQAKVHPQVKRCNIEVLETARTER